MKTAQPAPPAVVENSDIGWRHFPEFEKLLSSEETPPPLLNRVERTCRQLDELMKSGSEADKARAKAAMTAFGRSLDLYRSLLEMRDEALKQK